MTSKQRTLSLTGIGVVVNETARESDSERLSELRQDAIVQDQVEKDKVNCLLAKLSFSFCSKQQSDAICTHPRG